MGLAAASRARASHSGRPGSVTLALALAGVVGLIGLTSLAAALPEPASAARPTLTPYTPGRHVYDYGNLFTPPAEARAEALAAGIENTGGGRVVVYTAELGSLPSADTLAEAWQVDGLLLTGWGDNGQATLGTTLSGRLTQEAGKFARDTSPAFESMESFSTSTLARVDGLLRHQHVFDGAGVLDDASHQQAEAEATTLGQKLGCQVFIDIAMTDNDDPDSTAFFNDMSSSFARTLVVALAVHGKTVGGWIDGNGVDSDLYETHAPWGLSSFSTETAPGGDVRAEIMRAIGGVQPTRNPGDEAAKAAESLSTWIHDSVTSFFANDTNVRASLGGLAVLIGSIAAFWLARRRRRRETGYADDESVLLPAPPAEMTPALAAIVASPLNSTRAVTVALLDLAAHGRIAFYDDPASFGLGAGIRVLGGAGTDGVEAGAAHAAHAARASALAFSRPLGPAEESLLEGVRSEAGGSAGIAPVGFGELRPLFEQTAEQLERVAAQRGWLRLQTRSVSIAWTLVGVALLAGAAACVFVRQPVAVACLGLAGLIILPRAQRMPLPLRTADGQITSAMVDAYRRTLRRALAGDAGSVPPWLASAEEAALWGYAWGLEGEVQAFVGRNVGAAMIGLGAEGAEGAEGADGAEGAASMAQLALLMRGMSRSSGGKPVGLDTDAIASTLRGLGRSLAMQTGDVAAHEDDSPGR